MKTVKKKQNVLPKLKIIVQSLEGLPNHIFTLAELRQTFNENRQLWQLGSISFQEFEEALKKQSKLKEVRIEFPYRPACRYLWGQVSTFELLQSINVAAYFSHFTAMQLHGITEQIPKTIYLNIEQPRKSGGGVLSQVGIDRAFKSKCRVSKNKAFYKDRTVCLLNGANTGQLGVIDIRAPEGESRIRVTNIERTLIDSTVRPIYAGGVFEVAKAFENAREQASANKIAAYLRKLNYTYPYHQAIGFYMQRANFKSSQVQMMRQFDIEFDFYLDYQIKQSEYDRTWRLHIPKGF